MKYCWSYSRLDLGFSVLVYLGNLPLLAEPSILCTGHLPCPFVGTASGWSYMLNAKTWDFEKLGTVRFFDTRFHCGPGMFGAWYVLPLNCDAPATVFECCDLKWCLKGGFRTSFWVFLYLLLRIVLKSQFCLAWMLDYYINHILHSDSWLLEKILNRWTLKC